MSDSHLTKQSFAGLHLPESLQKGLEDASFEYCTPIQAQSLPRALAGLDVAGQAQTGTGKTAAFLVALYTRLIRQPPAALRSHNAPRALIIAPTRELAVQIHRDAQVLGAHTGLSLGLAFGGVDYDKQRHQLAQGVDVLIGTPGRTIDFVKQRVIELRSVQVLVLDEADRMFDLGFIADIRYILRRLPAAEQRLNMLFSATLSRRVLELAYEHMNDPELVRIEADKMTVERIRQVIYYPSNEEKPRLLVGLLKRLEPPRSMVFVNTRRAAEQIERLLRDNGIDAEAISGDVPQRKRLRMLQDFRKGALSVLIGTDVASRGLHIPDVSHVFNYDLPQDPEDYVHRIGRTARAGAEGDAISFGCEEYVISLPDIEAYIGRKIPVEAVPQELLVEISTPAPLPRTHHARDQRAARGGSRAAAGPRRRSSRQDRPASPKPRSSEPRAPDRASAGSAASAASAASPAEHGDPAHLPALAKAASGEAAGTKAHPEDSAAAGSGGKAAPHRRRRRRKPAGKTAADSQPAATQAAPAKAD